MLELGKVTEKEKKIAAVQSRSGASSSNYGSRAKSTTGTGGKAKNEAHEKSIETRRGLEKSNEEHSVEADRCSKRNHDDCSTRFDGENGV